MPTIASFYGISIRMYLKDHPPPHFHAVYGADEAFIDIRSGAILKGKLPRAAARLVAEWGALRRGELLANWERAHKNVPLMRIAGPDAD